MVKRRKVAVLSGQAVVAPSNQKLELAASSQIAGVAPSSQIAGVAASSQVAEIVPKTKRRKSVVMSQPVQVSILEPVQIEPVEVALQVEPVPVEPEQIELPVEVEPAKRGRRKKEVLSLAAPELTLEPSILLESTVLTKAPKARGRPKKIVVAEVAPEVIKPKARGRAAQPKTSSAELLPEPARHPETLEIIPQVPVAPKLVRLRREAREHVFSHQGVLYNPFEALLEHFRATPSGLNSREISADLDEALLERLGGRKGLEEAISGLERDGYLIVPKRGIHQSSRDFVPIVGRLELRSDGTGWFTPDTPGLRSMLIPSGSLLFAWHGDRVVARELRRNGQSEGEVIRVLERARNSLTGTLEHQRGYALLRPDETHLPSIALESNGLVSGTRLAADILYPEDSGEDEALARVKNVLGDASSLESERAAVMARFALPEVFSAEAQKEAAKLGSITAKDLKGRIDLRGKKVYALAGLEMALQIEPLGNGNVLLAVHYADAAHWIDEGSPLEKAMLARGAACQLSGQNLSLFPQALLSAMEFAPDTERLALSVLIETSDSGSLINYVVRPSVVGMVGTISSASQLEQGLIAQIGGLPSALALANRLCSTAIAASDVMAFYRLAGEISPELPSALERSSGFDPSSLVIKTLSQKLTQPSSLQAIHASAAAQGLCLANSLTRAADFINIRILSWCATKLSVRKRQQLLETLPSLAPDLQRLEQRAASSEQNLEQFLYIQNLNQTYPMRGVVIGISEFMLEIVLENGAIGQLALEDLGEEATFSPNQWKTRLGRVFKPGSIVRVVVEKTRPATREAQLALHQKESHMSRLHRRKPGANASSTTPGAKPSVGKSVARRGVVVLGNRPRAEYPRPVRITARKLYFGEWSKERFAELEGDNPEFEMTRPTPRPSRPLPKGNAEVRTNRPHEARPPRPHQPRSEVVTARAPHPKAAQPDTSRNSRIEALRQRQLQALERNANRAQSAPAPVTPIVASETAEASPVTSKPAYRSRRRPNRTSAA